MTMIKRLEDALVEYMEEYKNAESNIVSIDESCNASATAVKYSPIDSDTDLSLAKVSTVGSTVNYIKFKNIDIHVIDYISKHHTIEGFKIDKNTISIKTFITANHNATHIT